MEITRDWSTRGQAMLALAIGFWTSARPDHYEARDWVFWIMGLACFLESLYCIWWRADRRIKWL